MQTLATIADGTVSMARPQAMSAAGSGSTLGVRRTSLIGIIGRRLEDALLLILAVFLVPVGILLIGTPIALCARLVLELVRRL
jgi:hypothetical protein